MRLLSFPSRILKHYLLALTVTILCVSASSAAIIDDFRVGSITLERSNVQTITHLQTGLDPLHVLGGARTFVLGEFGVDGQYVNVDTVSETLTLGRPPGSTGLAYLKLSYGSDQDPLAVDLTAGGNDRFAFDLISARPPGFLRVGSPGGRTSTASLFPLSLSPHVLFSDFSGDADFQAISWIKLDVSRSSGFIMGALRTVPEPPPGILLLLFLGLVGTRRSEYQVS